MGRPAPIPAHRLACSCGAVCEVDEGTLDSHVVAMVYAKHTGDGHTVTEHLAPSNTMV